MSRLERERRIIDGTAWRDFCRSIERAGDTILQQGTPEDPFQRAEGLRYLTRLLRAGLESHVESADPRYPRFYQLANETIKIGNDNPDNLYHNANLDGRLAYRIRGRRNSVPYLTFITYGGICTQDGKPAGVPIDSFARARLIEVTPEKEIVFDMWIEDTAENDPMPLSSFRAEFVG